MICEVCEKNQTSSEYEVNGKRLALCFFCFRDFLEQNVKPIKIKEEEQRRREIESGDASDPLRNFDIITKDWVRKFLGLSGIIRNEYSQITDIYKRPSERQIRGMLKELLKIEISEKKIRQYRKYLIGKGELLSDEEFKEQQPTREILRETKRSGVRAMAIQRSREKKSHLSPEELEQILDKNKPKKSDEESNESRIAELKRKEEKGLYLTASEEREIEQHEESYTED